MKCALFGMCPSWNVNFLECALLRSKWNLFQRNALFLVCAQYRMCTLWNVFLSVFFLEYAHFGMCPFWNVIKMELAQN